MPSNLIMSKVLVIFAHECLSCGEKQRLTIMWQNVVQPVKDQCFCTTCCHNEQGAKELYMRYVIGPKPKTTPPAIKVGLPNSFTERIV